MHFFISAPKTHTKNPTNSSKVAPGMSITYEIVFTPEERKDYTCDLIVETERERFFIPVQALGHLGICLHICVNIMHKKQQIFVVTYHS